MSIYHVMDMQALCILEVDYVGPAWISKMQYEQRIDRQQIRDDNHQTKRIQSANAYAYTNSNARKV